MKITLIISLTALLLLFGCSALQTKTDPSISTSPTREYSFKRIYKAGEKHLYRLSRHYFTNGQFKNETIAQAELTTILKDNSFSELVSWNRLSEDNSKENKNLDSRAKKVPPFSVSLQPGSKITIPKLDVAEMVGMITDFITFYVAISPHAGIQNLHTVGDTYKTPKPQIASWSDGVITTLGEDCISISLKLVELTQTTVSFETSFLPPIEQCLSMNKPWMLIPVVGKSPNNFQQIRKDGDKYSAMWGQEKFVVKTLVDRKTGIIINSQMHNFLKLQMKHACSSELTECLFEGPLTIRRELILSKIAPD